MSAHWTSVERPQGYVKPVKKSRGSLALTVFYRLLQPVTFAYLSVTIQEPRAFSFPDTAASAPTPTPPPTPTAAFPYSPPPPSQLERLFIDALARSCLYRQHMRISHTQTLVSHLYHKPRRKRQNIGRQVRHLHFDATSRQPPSRRNTLSREECLDMLDWYQEPLSTQAQNVDSERCEPPSDPTTSLLADSMHEALQPLSHERKACLSASPPPLPSESFKSLQLSEPPEPSKSRGNRRGGAQALSNLHEVLRRDDCTHEAAFEAYSVLPSPGVSYLSGKAIQLLFHRLSVMEKKDYDSMLRYLSVVEDTKTAGLQLTYTQWNSAIAFCGQCFDRVTAVDVERALQTWKEMEKEAEIKGGNITFNILFDIAAKAGKFVLAEMIFKEMEARNLTLTLNRYARVSHIFYHGLRADGEAIRGAYRDFVNAGQIVDTVVMNCLIASLLRAGEPGAAEQIYERMKRRVADRQGKSIPYLDWKQVRELGRVLNRAARDLKNQPNKLQQLRDEQTLAPNVRTYAIFLEHHVSQTGELSSITPLLSEMQELGLPLDGRIFFEIFKGFALHGGVRYTSWTKARLESVWNAFLAVLDESDVVIKKWVIEWTVRAFRQCAGEERTLEVWGEVRRRWKGREWGEVEEMLRVLQDVLKPP